MYFLLNILLLLQLQVSHSHIKLILTNTRYNEYFNVSTSLSVHMRIKPIDFYERINQYAEQITAQSQII